MDVGLRRACRSSRPGYEGHSLSFCAIRRRSCSGPSTRARTRVHVHVRVPLQPRPRHCCNVHVSVTNAQHGHATLQVTLGRLSARQRCRKLKKRSRRRALFEDDRCDCWRLTRRHLIVTCWSRVSAPTRRRCGEPRLPAGACPPLVSTLSFGGDDMSSLSTGPRAEDGRRVEGSVPGLIWRKVWTVLQPGSSTWLFPEHCLETRRVDVTAGAAGPGSVMTSPTPVHPEQEALKSAIKSLVVTSCGSPH